MQQSLFHHLSNVRQRVELPRALHEDVEVYMQNTFGFLCFNSAN